MELEQFEKDILDYNDDGSNVNIKIKPSFYIHNAILMAQRTLMFSVVKTNVGDGIVAYGVFIEHIEVLCRAANFLSDDYEKDLGDFKDSEEYTNVEDKRIKMARLSNKKLQFLMREVFGRSDLKAPLSDSKKK